jgi:hypothetical protein
LETLPGADQTLTEMIQAGSKTHIPRFMSLITLFGIRKSSKRNILLCLRIGREIKLTNNYQGISLFISYMQNFIHKFFQKLIPHVGEILGITSVDFYIINQQLIRQSAFIRYVRKMIM